MSVSSRQNVGGHRVASDFSLGCQCFGCHLVLSRWRTRTSDSFECFKPRIPLPDEVFVNEKAIFHQNNYFLSNLLFIWKKSIDVSHRFFFRSRNVVVTGPNSSSCIASNRGNELLLIWILSGRSSSGRQHKQRPHLFR